MCWLFKNSIVFFFIKKWLCLHIFLLPSENESIMAVIDRLYQWFALVTCQIFTWHFLHCLCHRLSGNRRVCSLCYLALTPGSDLIGYLALRMTWPFKSLGITELPKVCGKARRETGMTSSLFPLNKLLLKSNSERRLLFCQIHTSVFKAWGMCEGKKNIKSTEGKCVMKAKDLLEVFAGNREIKLFDLGIWPFRAVEWCATKVARLETRTWLRKPDCHISVVWQSFLVLILKNPRKASRSDVFSISKWSLAH